MSTFNKIFTKTLGVAILTVGVIGFGLTNIAQAGTPYDPNGTPTLKTPIFNEFYNVPSGVGDEADFVRVRPQAGTNADYVNSLSAACNVGDQYTVRTYVHNGADPSFNDNGNGSAVAHNTVAAMKAELGTAKSKFEFKSTISASNAASVTDTGYLDCGTKTVKLHLVASSVQTYSKPLGFQSASDTAVNGTLKIGSRVQGSGDQWACWDDRIIITYNVQVEEVPPTPQPQPQALSCKLLVDRKSLALGATIQPYVTNVTVTGYKIDFTDGTVVNTQTATHTYTTYGDHKVVGTVTGTGTQDGKTLSATCEYAFNEKEPTTPPVTPPTPPTPPTPVTPTTPTTPPTMPKTGAGSLVGLISGVSIVGAVGHRFWMIRRMQ